MASEAVAADVPPTPEDAIASIGRQVAELSTGDHARLRRIYLTRSPAADGVVLGLLHGADIDLHMPVEMFDRWRILAHVAAVLSGTGKKYPHSRKPALGAALHKAGYSENRLRRLLAARGEQLFDQIARAARMLSQDGQTSVDLWSIMLLTGRDPVKARAARIRIAQDYYSAAHFEEGDAK